MTQNNNMEEHFDAAAATWDDKEKIKRAEDFAKAITDFLKPDGKMSGFEFGCGTGLLGYSMRDSFSHLTMADNSEGMLAVLKEKIDREQISNMTPLQIDLLKENPPEEKYDAIFTLMTLHHVMDIDKILDIFKSMLNEDGYVCIGDLDKEDGSFHGHMQNFNGHKGFDRQELGSTLEHHGFEVVHYSIPHEIKKQKEDTEKKYPIFLMIGKKK